MYTKEQQLKSWSKPKWKNRSAIDHEDYRKATEYWGVCCIACGNPNIEMHHVKFRSNGGSGRWRNLLPLCQNHHKLAHTYKYIRYSYEEKMIDEFGQDYFKDEWHLYEEGKIDEPKVELMEAYFNGTHATD